jgi:uncharacterized protein YdeI (BOF family)
MRKLIIATAALALLSSTAMAQDKAGGTSTAPAATSGDTMSKGDTTKMSKKHTKSKKSAKKTGDDTMQKQ